MSLVAYDSSDDSEEEIISSSLCKPFYSKSLSDTTVKKQRECIKITIPALKEFRDDESPVALKKPKLQSGRGLFNLLPPPINASTLSKPGFVPYVLSSKKGPSLSQKSETKIAKAETPSTVSHNVPEEEDYDDETSYNNENSSEENLNATSSKDFFSLNKFSSENKIKDKSYLSSNCKTTDSSLAPVENINLIQNVSSKVQLPSTSSPDIQQSLQNESTRSLYFQQYQLPQIEITDYEQEDLLLNQQSYSLPNYSTKSVNELDSKESLLKDKEFLKLQGKRCEFEDLDIIDVNADDQLTDRNKWLMKSLTEESSHRPSSKKHNMPTQQQKRKHQITYLAFQAKEREMDLKNQWALNSRTRRETQAKYGF